MEEKNTLIATLESNKNAFLTLCAYSEGQRKFKPSAEAWSIDENIEHLAHTEKSFFHVMAWTLQQPAMTSEAAAHKASDNFLKKALANRSVKIKAPDRLNPTGALDMEAARAKFLDFREQTIALLRDTTADLHAHFWTHPFLGVLDAHQVGLNTCEHLNRHLAQVEEIKAAELFLLV